MGIFVLSNNNSIFKQNTKTKLIIFVCAFIVASIVIYYVLPAGTHWKEIYRPAALRLLQGKSPYGELKFFNPPWALFPIIPFAILPEQLGHALLGSFTLVSFAYVAMQYGAKPLTLFLLFTMPLTLYNAVQINVDWLMVWGLLLPPQIGLFFVLVKPQLGVFLAFYWFIEALKSGGAKRVFKVFAPVSIAFLLSFAIFGNYFQRATVVFNESDKTFWPASIPVGLAILIISFRTKKAELSLSASLLLSPYIQPYSIPLAIFGLLPDQLLTNVFLFGLWFMVLDPNRGYIFERLIEPFVR